MPETQNLVLPTLAATMDLGRGLGRRARPGQVIALTGDLGAGKTTLTQAIGQGLLVPAGCYITSPTFNILHEYPGRIPLYHLDLYRLHSEEEIEDLGLPEYLYGDGLAVVEWPDRLGALLPENRLEVALSITGQGGRTAVLTARGEGHNGLLDLTRM